LLTKSLIGSRARFSDWLLNTLRILLNGLPAESYAISRVD